MNGFDYENAEKILAQELAEAHRAIVSLISKCIKVQKKLRKGTPQHTLTKNRLKAFRVASVLIKKEAGKN